MTPNRTTFPIAKPSSPEAKRAAELHAAWLAHDDRLNAVRRDQRAAEQAEHAASLELQDLLFAEVTDSATPAVVKAATRKLDAAAEKTAEPWGHRIEAAQSATRTAHGTFQTYVNEHLEELLDELEPDAQDAHDAFRDALTAVSDAIANLGRQTLRHEFFVHLVDVLTIEDAIQFGALSDLRTTVDRVKIQVEEDIVRVPGIDPVAIQRRRSFLSTGLEESDWVPFPQ